jgi:hypothetical protein
MLLSVKIKQSFILHESIALSLIYFDMTRDMYKQRFVSSVNGNNLFDV